MVTLDALVVSKEVGGHAILTLGHAEELATVGDGLGDFVATIASFVQVMSLFAGVALVFVLFVLVAVVHSTDRLALVDVVFDVQLVEHLRLASHTRVPGRVVSPAVLGRVGDAVSVQVEVVILANQANIGNWGQFSTVDDVVGQALSLVVVEVLLASHALVEQGVVDLAVGHGVRETQTATVVVVIHASLALIRTGREGVAVAHGVVDAGVVLAF